MRKDSMPARLARVEDLLRARVSSSSGGWPHWLQIDNASTSLVGTAHALAMLRMRGLDHSHSLVDGGLRYLARETPQQLKPGGRGMYARYPAYSLWGLLRFPASLSDPEIFEGAKFSASWLLNRTRPSGAWTVDAGRDDEREISLPATMAAVHGLDRIAPHALDKFGARCMEAAAAARGAIVRSGVPTAKGTCWRQLDGGTACPGATSLAVLTLAGGSADHREVARQGLDWLGAHHREWTTSVHIDDQLEQLTWRIMSFSLGLRAILHPCASSRPPKSILQNVVAHFDAIWDGQTGAWAVQQGHAASTTGSYAVFAAVRSLKNAWDFDPVSAYGLKREAVRRRPRSTAAGRVAPPTGAQRRVRVAQETTGIYISDPASSEREFYVSWDGKASSQWGILKALLERKAEANERQSQDQYDYTLSPAELTAFTKNSEVGTGTIERTIRRINDKIRSAASEVPIHSFPVLIEKIVPGDSDETRFGIEETDVVVAPPDR